MAQDGTFIQQKLAFGSYMIEWFNGLYTDTAALTEFKARPVAQAIQWAPSRMIDEAESMLAAFRKNENGPPGSTTKLPIVLLATDDDFLGTGADWGGAHTDFELVQILKDGSWYEHREVNHDRRIQVVIVASESDTAKSIAAQLSAYLQQPKHRYFDSTYQFGQYAVPAGNQLETKRVDWMQIKTEAKNIKILAGDIALKCVVPIFRAPGVGEPNDGTTNNPPGYPLVRLVQAQQSMGADFTELAAGDERLSE